MAFIRHHHDDSKLSRKQRQYSLKLAAAMLMSKMGYFPMFEVPVNPHLRADLLCVKKIKKAPFYSFALIEVKSTVADFKSDDKWTGYLDYCDEFYFCSDSETIESIQNSIQDAYPQVGFIAARHLWNVNAETAFILKNSELHHDKLDRMYLLYLTARSNCLFLQGLYKGLHKVNIDALDCRYNLDNESELGGLV